MFLRDMSMTTKWDPAIQAGFEAIRAKWGADPRSVPFYLMCGVRPSTIEELGTYTVGDRDLEIEGVPGSDQVAHVRWGGLDAPAMVIPRFNGLSTLEWDLHTVVHEWGHVLHCSLGGEDFGLPNITTYAEDYPEEQFAECFTWWVLGPERYWAQRDWQKLDGDSSDIELLFQGLKKRYGQSEPKPS